MNSKLIKALKAKYKAEAAEAAPSRFEVQGQGRREPVESRRGARCRGAEARQAVCAGARRRAKHVSVPAWIGYR